MGIVGYYKWLRKTFPGSFVPLNSVVRPATADKVDNIYIDINAILHTEARKSNSQFYFATLVIKYISTLLNQYCPPRKNVFMAIDGPAPWAKTWVQRVRREKEAIKALAKLDADGSPANKRQSKPLPLHSAALTPGTETMRNIDGLMSYFACRWLISRPAPGITFTIAGSEVPGEGEHKILQHLTRRLKSGKLTAQRLGGGAAAKIAGEVSIIVGCDADLFVQVLATGAPNTFCWNSSETPLSWLSKGRRQGDGKQQQQIRNNDHQPPLQIFSSSHFMQELQSKLLEYQKQTSPAAAVRQQGLDLERIRDDFVMISLMIGNDYLPRMRGALIDSLWEEYLAIKCSPKVSLYRLGQVDYLDLRDRYLVNRGASAAVHLDLVIFHALCSAVSRRLKAPLPDWQEQQKRRKVQQTVASSSLPAAESSSDKEDEEGGGGGDDDEVQITNLSKALAAEPRLLHHLLHTNGPSATLPLSSSSSNTAVDAPNALPAVRNLPPSVERYLHGLLWCHQLFASGECPQWDYEYHPHLAVSVVDICRWIADRCSGEQFNAGDRDPLLRFTFSPDNNENVNISSRQRRQPRSEPLPARHCTAVLLPNVQPLNSLLPGEKERRLSDDFTANVRSLASADYQRHVDDEHQQSAHSKRGKRPSRRLLASAEQPQRQSPTQQPAINATGLMYRAYRNALAKQLEAEIMTSTLAADASALLKPSDLGRLSIQQPQQNGLVVWRQQWRKRERPSSGGEQQPTAERLLHFSENSAIVPVPSNDPLPVVDFGNADGERSLQPLHEYLGSRGQRWEQHCLHRTFIEILPEGSTGSPATASAQRQRHRPPHTISGKQLASGAPTAAFPPAGRR